jgi:hypothetical protein
MHDGLERGARRWVVKNARGESRSVEVAVGEQHT